jgi:ABC-type sugar transport system permease subunit
MGLTQEEVRFFQGQVSVYQGRMAFRELELGYGSAMGVVLFVIILVLTLAQMRFLRTRWQY